MGWVHNASQEINDRSQWPTILAVVLCLTIIMLTTVALRWYVRGIMLSAVGKDDWVILFCAVCSVIYGGLAVGQSRWGLGLNPSDRPKVNLNHYSVINFAGRPFYMAGIAGFKVALCISYLRILQQSNRAYHTVVWIVMISCVILHVAGALVLMFQCKPVYKSWKPATVGSCLPNDKTFYALAGVTIFYDCVIFLLPIPILMHLQINTRRKVALIGVFLLGLFTTICSIMRMLQIITIAKTGNSTMLVLWGTIELNVGVSLCCLPTLTPLFTYFREKTTTARYGYSDSHPKDKSGGGHSLSILKSKQNSRSRITETSSGRWRDSDENDNSSQKGIIAQVHSVANVGDEENSGGETKGRGITATTRVEVKIEDGAKKEAGSTGDGSVAKMSKWGS